MADYDNTDSGALFKNDRKEKESHPDYRGQLNVGGVEYWISAWLKTGKKGKFMSLAIQPKDEAPKGKAKAKSVSDDDFDSDVPF